MRSHLSGGLLLSCLIGRVLLAGDGRAEPPPATPEHRADWPHTVVVSVGDVRTRIEKAKLWTLSGIEHQGNIMATEDSAYGTVLTIRDVGLLGTAHFLDLPGQPGQIETEQVLQLELFVDDQPVSEITPQLHCRGDSFRKERRSRIRALDLATTVALKDGVLTETARFRATGPLDLRVAYPWMYAWSARNTDYVFGDEHGIRQRGQFLTDGQTVSQVVNNVSWMAVFDAAANRGGVCCIRQHPPHTDRRLLLVDAPGIYRKVAAYALEDQVLAPGYEGTFQSAVGFFTATHPTWEAAARQRAAELQPPTRRP